jgi:ABC-2 type transport system ATP-binding protein
MRRRDRCRSADHLLGRVGMTSWASKRLKTYSKGMLQRIGLAQALVNEPDLVVLDEPTDGVDPVGRREIRDLLLELRSEGKTIFLNSHLLSELEMICDRVAIMVKGQVAMQGTIDELTHDSRRFEIDVQGDAPDWTDSMPGTTTSPQDGFTRIILRTEQAEDVQPLIDRLRAEGRTINRITPVRESLEDLFMRAVTEDDGTVQAPGGMIKSRTGRP